MEILYFDIETTGFPEKNDPVDYKEEIVEVSYIYTSNGYPVQTYSKKIQHSGYCKEGAYKVHGIADFECMTPINDMVKDFFVVAKSSDIICGHNVSFDLARMKNIGNVALNNILDKRKIVCTMQDFPILNKLIYAGVGKNKMLIQSKPSLWDCESFLINRGYYTEEDIQQKFKELFPDQLHAQHHSSAYDTLVCYLCHQVLMKIC